MTIVMLSLCSDIEHKKHKAVLLTLDLVDDFLGPAWAILDLVWTILNPA